MDKITFKYIALDLIEKIIRLKSYITKNSSRNDNNSNKAVIQIFEKTISNILFNIKFLILDINDIDFDSTTDEKYAIQQNLSQCYISIKDLHKELNFLSTDWLKIETYTFTEQLYDKHFNLSPKRDLSIILSDDYTFIETNLDKRFEKITASFFEQESSTVSEEMPTVIIPKLEYSNPLNWTILVHELGHINSAEIISLRKDSAIFPSDLSLSEKEKLVSWAEEIYCDIKAIQIIGPAYFLSLSTFALLESLIIGFGVSTKSHPPFAMRLALLFSYLDKNSLDIKANLPNGKNDTIHSFIYAMSKDINENLKNKTETIVSEPSIDGLMIFHKNIRSKLIKDEKISRNVQPIFELVKDLEKMIPIGSHRSHDKDDEYLNKIDSPELNKEEFTFIKDYLTERNADLWEIINAGWVYKMQEIIPFGLKLFFENTSNSITEKVSLYSEKLERLDDRLLVSIETSKLIDLIEK